MLPSSTLFDRWISRPKRPWVGVIIAVFLLVAPFPVAWVEGEMPWLIETGRWRSILVAPVIITYVLAVAPRLAALEARVLVSLRPLLVDEQAGLRTLTQRAGAVSRRKEVAAFSLGAALAMAVSSQGWREGFTWLELVLILEQALMYGLLGVVVYGSLASTRVTSTLLGLDLKIDPLDVSPFVAIGRQSLWIALIFVGGITLSLVFLGMQPEYLLLWEFWVIYAPLIVVPLVVFFLNMAPTHRRLQAARDTELKRVEALIRQECTAMVRQMEAGEEPSGAEQRIPALTAYETRLQQARTWPYNTAMLRTVFVSVLIPGGTIVGRVVAELANR
jgi:hypothetical protein